MKNLATLILSFSLVGAVFACSENGKTGFVPENNLRIPVGMKTNGGLTEAQFNTVIEKIETIYAPIVTGMG
jgi:hypothetical protein